MQSPSPGNLTDNSKSIENNFEISMQFNDLPIMSSPSRIDLCLVCICQAGNAEIEVDLRSYRFAKNDIIIVFPGQILACNDKSGDFSVCYFTFSNQLIDEILYRLPTAFIGFLKENVRYHLPEEEKNEMLAEYISILHRKFCDIRNVCRGEIITNLVHNFYLDLYNKVVADNRIPTRERKHKKELQDDFFSLIKEHTTIREVSFFAEKLCITPKYLSIVTKETTGSSAKDLIDKFAVTELKLRLKATSNPLKEIAVSLNYPSEAFLCKFFKKHTGMTPSHFRNTSR